ncbi:MAG TPA: hypothetical protein VFT22_18735 [Kofleriaceae bacterium]|nr:hypothetical protein [Kofleriaceae bacterium]
MRFPALALMACLAGCSLSPGGSVGGECNSDSQCGEDVCAQSGECLARANVRGVTVRWTVNGAAPSDASCSEHPTLYLQFDGTDYGDTLRLAPVACQQGSVTIGKLPRRYGQVEIGFEGSAGAGDVSSIDTTSAQAQLDLFQ